VVTVFTVAELHKTGMLIEKPASTLLHGVFQDGGVFCSWVLFTSRTCSAKITATAVIAAKMTAAGTMSAAHVPALRKGACRNFVLHAA
jgi:hypothetical protein